MLHVCTNLKYYTISLKNISLVVDGRILFVFPLTYKHNTSLPSPEMSLTTEENRKVIFQ